MYKKEMYRNMQRFNQQYEDIHTFLAENADNGVNEHFHWGRFRWHMGHSMLETEKLTSIAIFRNETGKVCGLVTYDTDYDDRNYILHNGDKELVAMMIQHVISAEGNKAQFMVNERDLVLSEMLLEYGFQLLKQDNCVLQMNLNGNLSYKLPDGFELLSAGHAIDMMKYQMVIFKGFNNEGIVEFEPWADEVMKPQPHDNNSLRVLVADGMEYCAHCGIWYESGETAYIEPVVTIPRCRSKGLGKVVVYEALSRVRDMGAKRAVVVSDQPFYHSIGFNLSSEYNVWGRL